MPTDYAMNRVQVDSRARTAAQARAVGNEVTAKLSGFRGVYDGIQFQGCFQMMRRSSHDKADGKEWFTDSRDFTIHWAPA